MATTDKPGPEWAIKPLSTTHTEEQIFSVSDVLRALGMTWDPQKQSAGFRLANGDRGKLVVTVGPRKEASS